MILIIVVVLVVAFIIFHHRLVACVKKEKKRKIHCGKKSSFQIAFSRTYVIYYGKLVKFI